MLYLTEKGICWECWEAEESARRQILLSSVLLPATQMRRGPHPPASSSIPGDHTLSSVVKKNETGGTRWFSLICFTVAIFKYKSPSIHLKLIDWFAAQFFFSIALRL
jgi:hypothetical protein